MPLPDYDLSLNNASTARDVAEFVLTHNLNMGEIVSYVNSIRGAVNNITGNQGTTPTQVREIIQSERYEILIPVVWATNTLPIDSTNPTLGTMTRTQNDDDSVTITVTNIKNTRKLIPDIRTFSGEIAYVNVTVTESFITINIDRIEDLSVTPGHTDNSTDPNIKRLILI